MKVGKGTRQGDEVMDEDKTNKKERGGGADVKQHVDLLMKGKAAACAAIVSPH